MFRKLQTPKSELSSVKTSPVLYIKSSVTRSESEIKTDPGSNEKYEQGIVFYMDKNKVVGVLTWNIFGKIPIARQVSLVK